jgi:hypothetical protein
MISTGPPRTSCTSTARATARRSLNARRRCWPRCSSPPSARASPCLPYARELSRQGLRSAAERLDRIDPLLCRQLLADRLAEADWESRFLTGSWQTLVSRTWPLLTERVVRTFGGSDFRPADLLGEEPISVYLRLTERDMRGLKPLLRLVWETLLGELVAHHDRSGGHGCNPVLLVLDEAARFAVP